MKLNSSDNIILGSQSPRRKELLSTIIDDFKVITYDVEEIIPASISTNNAAKYLATLKANAFQKEISNHKTIITADTIVLLGDEILGKPKDKKEALAMLSSLSNRSHQVITGVCIKNTEKEKVFDVTTHVYFNPLSSEDINYYIESYKPFDKAGSYGIQEWLGMIGVSKIEGCYYNVMGLPVSKLYEILKKEFLPV